MSMDASALIRRLQLPIAIGCAVLALALAASRASACILLPEHQEFTATDLESAPEGFRAPATSSSSRDPSALPPSPLDEPEGEQHPWDFLKASLPNDGGASTSPTGSTTILTLVNCLPGTTVAIESDSVSGQLPETGSVVLPSPAGTELLRPPKS